MGSSPDTPDTPEDGIEEEALSDASSLIALLGHFYRGQLERETTWRSRLDRTTEWSVIVIATLLTWAFTSRENPHYILLIGVLLVILFLAIDTRRYRAYDVWRSRIQMLEQDLFAHVFDPESGVEHREWQRMMSEDLRRPVIKIGLREAVTQRLRRVYLPLVTVILIGWLFHITVFQPAESWIASASVIGAPGEVVVVAVGLIYVTILLLTVWPVRRDVAHEFSNERPDVWDFDEEKDE